MTTSDTNFLLAEVSPDLARSASEWPIKKIIRSYLSERRADEDRDLLVEANPSGTYVVLSIHHIDN